MLNSAVIFTVHSGTKKGLEYCYAGLHRLITLFLIYLTHNMIVNSDFVYPLCPLVERGEEPNFQICEKYNFK